LATRKLVLIGFMGAGKSTAARNAADALGMEPFDADRVVEDRAGRSIEQIFAEEGEAAFRALEERTTLELLGDAAVHVLALGGGALSSRAIRDALAEHLVVWLDVSLDTAWGRVAGSGRPLARDRAAFAALYEEREPVYAALADVTASASSPRRPAASRSSPSPPMPWRAPRSPAAPPVWTTTSPNRSTARSSSPSSPQSPAALPPRPARQWSRRR